MNKIVFKIEGGEDVTIFAVDGDNVLELARKANVSIDAPCSGNGTCGKCRVRVLEGNLGGAGHQEDGWRLACESVVDGDAQLSVPNTALAYISNITTEVYDKNVPLPCVSCRGDRPRSPAAGRYTDNGRPGTVAPTGEFHQYKQGVGLAIDVGTTTVSALLVDMDSGCKLAKATTGNGQIRYGADVINRIIEQQKPGGIHRLQKAIVQDTLVPLIDSLRKTTGVSRESIARIIIASNTTMNHLLLGVDANSIRTPPYEPAFLEFEPYDPASIGINIAPDAKLILAPNIGSYVGGDITAGVLATSTASGEKMWNRADMSLLIDLGTNGEIVFGNNEFLMACACSAGPAFEGGDISCGMRATVGAIEACFIGKQTTPGSAEPPPSEKGAWTPEPPSRTKGVPPTGGGGCLSLASPSFEPTLAVIGGGKPVGLCGSGLIDVVAELFRVGIINGKGKFNCEGDRIRYDEYGIGSYVLAFAEDSATGMDITLNEVDIDNFIRAKGAIFSGIMSLLTPLGFTPADIDDVLIAGGIGSGINIKSAINIGMLPNLPEEKYSYIGNSSLDGAYEMLSSQDAQERVIEIARNMTYVDLSTEPGYMDEFIAACFLPHTDETLFS